MTAGQLTGTPQETGRPRRRGLTLLLLASIIVSFLAASSAPTPLYALYAAQWRFSPLATTVVFGVYALAVLASLLTFGKLSDHVGRRPVLLAGLVLEAVAMVQFATAGGFGTLLGARIVQGVATGLTLASAGAAMLDLDRRRGALANASAPGAGTALGALIAALALNRASARSVLYLGIAALIAGITVTLVATSADSAVGFFTGTAVAGVGFGGGFQGSIRLVVPLVSEQDRAGVLSLLYVVVYLGLGVPAVIGGVLVTEVNGLQATAREYGSAVVVLAALALAGLLMHRPRNAPRQEGLFPCP